MKRRKISLRSLPNQRGQAPESAFSAAFVKILSTAHAQLKDKAELEFDLQEASWISPAELVALSCCIRSLASHGIECHLKLPDNRKNPLAWTLHSYRLPQLLGYPAKSSEWQKRIHFGLYEQPSERPHEWSASRHVIPLTWIDLAAFGVSRDSVDLYAEEPQFDIAYAEFLRSVLVSRGFVADDSVDLLVRGVLRELGWNAVLHSDGGRSPGYAAFAGQVFAEKKLEFAISDMGCGVVSNLAHSYEVAVRKGEVPDYASVTGCSDTAAIIRYAFDPSSTSRPTFLANIDRFSDRGLALVAEIVKERGVLSMVSSDSVVTVSSSSRSPFVTRNLPRPIPGTTLFGMLNASSRKDSSANAEKNEFSDPDIGDAKYYSIAALLERGCSRPHEFLRRVSLGIGAPVHTAVLDCGFADRAAKTIEGIIAEFLNSTRCAFVIVANIRSPNVSPSRITRQLARAGIKTAVRIAIVRGRNELLEISLTAEDFNVQENRKSELITGKQSWKTTALSYPWVCEFQYRVNEAYFETALSFARPKAGFYKGNIHLLNGNITDRYFSFVAHAEHSEDHDRRRWRNAFHRLLNIVADSSDNVPLKIVSFSAATRPLLERLPSDFENVQETYCLLSYDAPTRKELSAIIHNGDDIVLFTDVVATASLLSEIILQVRRLGANVKSIIALIDARENSSGHWDGVYEPEVAGIPLLMSCSLHRRMRESPLPNERSYWIDAVSAAPAQSFRKAPISATDVLSTIKIMDAAECLTIGHFVDGPRHSSVQVDTSKLLSRHDDIKLLTELELNKVISTDRWKDFRPKVALAPAGINRIDRLNVDSHETPNRPASEEYADIVCSLFSTRPKVASVPRTFEPGGQARCSAIDHISSIYEFADLVIVDDGVSTGGTLRSLLSQAARIGARRILVFALLARTTAEELEHWILTREISDLSTDRSASISLITPLHLPVPFVGEADCAQCTTLTTLATRNTINESAMKAWSEIAEDLRPQSEYLSEYEGVSYASAWATAYSLSELASRSAEGLEELREYLNEIRQYPDRYEIARAAIIRLYLIEWRLLSRARLRQNIRRIVREIVDHQLASAKTSDRLLSEAISLVRAVFPESYLGCLRQYKSRIVCSEMILDRVLSHLATLSVLGVGSEKISTVQELSDELARIPPQVNRGSARQGQHLSTLVSGNGEFEATRDPVRNVQKLKNVLHGSVVKHDVIGTLGELAKIRGSRIEALAETEYFTSMTLQLNETAIPAFEKHVYPLLASIESVLTFQLENLQLHKVINFDYFQVSKESSSHTLYSDMKHVRDACQNFGENVTSQSALEAGLSSARHALDRAFLPTSTLNKVINTLTELTIGDVIRRLGDFMRGTFSGANVEIDESVYGAEMAISNELRVFTSSALLSQFASLTKRNIEKHVLAKGVDSTALSIRIFGGFLAEGDRDYIIFHVANSGKPPNPDSMPRFRSRVFSNLLKRFDGYFVPAVRTRDDYGSAATLKLRLIKDQL